MERDPTVASTSLGCVSHGRLQDRLKAKRALKAAKKMAVLDILRGLRRHRLSHRVSTTRPEQRAMARLFELSGRQGVGDPGAAELGKV